MAATELSQSKFPPLPEAKSVVRGRPDTTDAATTRRRSKSAANKSGVGPEPTLSWNDIFANANTYLRPLRAVCQDDPMSDAMTATDCKGTSYAVELFGRARPPLQSRANARPQGKGSYKLDLSWHAIDRDLWPLGSWNKALGERGPLPRYKGGGKGKHRELDDRAIWTISKCSEIAQLNETDRQGVCAMPLPRGPRADFLATEVHAPSKGPRRQKPAHPTKGRAGRSPRAQSRATQAEAHAPSQGPRRALEFPRTAPNCGAPQWTWLDQLSKPITKR